MTQWSNDPIPSIVYLNIELGLAFGLRGLGLDLLFLQCAHDVNNAFEDVLQLMVGQRPAIERAHVLENLLLPVRFIDRHLCVALQAANLLRRLRALVQQLNHLAVKLVNFLSPVCDVHECDPKSTELENGTKNPSRSSACNEHKVFIVCRNPFPVHLLSLP